MPYIANPLEGIPLVNTFITDQSLLGTTPATDDKLIIFDESATALKQLTIAELQAGILVSPAFTGVPTAPTANAGTTTTQVATTAFVAAATTALNTVTEMTDVTITSIASNEILKWSGSAWVNQTLAEANILTVSGPTFTGVLTVGSAALSEADLEQIDDLTAGTAAASKALVLDASTNITGIGTIGSGNITSSGTVQGTTITATTAFVPDASDGAALGTTALEFSDLFLADGAIIYFGDDQDVNLTHVVDTGLTTDKDFTVGDDLFISGGLIDLKTSSGSAGLIKFYCETGNAHAQTLQGQPHSATATNVLLLPTGGNSTLVSLVSTDVLTNKTLTAPTINGVVGGTTTSQTITTLTSTTTNAGTLAAAAGSITDSSGAISFGNENLTTTGTLAAGTTTIGTLTVAAASITDSSGALSFGNENLTTTGTLAAGTTTIGTLTVAAASITDSSGALSFGNENLTTTGTLAAGTTTIGTLVLAAASITDSSGTINFGDENITTTGTTTTGNLTVTGTTTTVNTATLSVEDPLIILASGNSAGDAVDIGFYGLHDTTGSQDIYAGLFRDASDSGKWKLFGSLEEAPTTVVNVSGTNYATGTLVANLEGNVTGALTGNASGTAATVTTAAQPAITSVAAALTQGTLTTGSGSITDSSGAISFGNENLTTTGTLNAGVITGTGFTIGSAVIVEAELELLDGLTAGTAIASKVVTTDANIDTTGQRNLTITGELDAGSLDINGAADVSGVLTMSGDKIDMSGEDIDNIRSATFIDEVANGNTGGSMTIDWGAGQKQSVVLNGNCAFTFTAPDGPCNLILKITHAANTTTYTPTWTGNSTNVDWPAATAPTFTQTSGSVDIVAFYYDGTNANGTYYGAASLAMG